MEDVACTDGSSREEIPKNLRTKLARFAEDAESASNSQALLGIEGAAAIVL
ncbi:MAG: hypothetical protein ACOC3C_07325 [Candidatus Thorarchaeota archaeon]